MWAIPLAAPAVSFRVGNPFDELAVRIPALEAELRELEMELRGIPDMMRWEQQEFASGRLPRGAYLESVAQLREREEELERTLIPAKLTEISAERARIIASTAPPVRVTDLGEWRDDM